MQQEPQASIAPAGSLPGRLSDLSRSAALGTGDSRPLLSSAACTVPQTPKLQPLLLVTLLESENPQGKGFTVNPSLLDLASLHLLLMVSQCLLSPLLPTVHRVPPETAGHVAAPAPEFNTDQAWPIRVPSPLAKTPGSEGHSCSQCKPDLGFMRRAGKEMGLPEMVNLDWIEKCLGGL